MIDYLQSKDGFYCKKKMVLFGLHANGMESMAVPFFRDRHEWPTI